MMKKDIEVKGKISLNHNIPQVPMEPYHNQESSRTIAGTVPIDHIIPGTIPAIMS